MYLGTNSCICITFDKFYELYDQTTKNLAQFCIFFNFTLHHNLFITLLSGSKPILVLAIQFVLKRELNV